MSRNSDCIPFESTKWLWLVEDSKGFKYSVNLKEKTCSCRKWDLTGIPCKHACSAIAENKWDVEDFVDEAYHVKTYKACYEVDFNVFMCVY